MRFVVQNRHETSDKEVALVTRNAKQAYAILETRECSCVFE